MKYKRIVMTFAVLAVSPALEAQQSPSATATDEVVILTPFEVTASGDTGYLSAEAATGTRYATRIIDVPMSIQTIGSEFIEDFLALDLNDVVAYSSSFTPADGTGAFTLRGIRTTQSQYKNGIREGGIYAPADVDRVEIIRGPNAAIYGATEPSGLRNVVTKQAKPKPEFGLRLQGGTDDFYRLVLSVNQPIVKGRFLTRFDVSSDASKQYTQDFMKFRRKSLYNSSTWKIGPKTVLIYHLEYIKFRSEAQNAGTMPWVQIPVGVPNATGGTTTVNAYAGFMGTGIWQAYDHLNIGGPYGYNQVEYTQIDANLTHQFTKWLSLRILGSRWQRNQNIVRTVVSTGGTFNVFNTSTGILAGTASPRLERNREYQYNAQADLLLNFKTGPIKHKLLLTADYAIYDGEGRDRTSSNVNSYTKLNTAFWGDQKFYNPLFDYSFDFENTALWGNLEADYQRQTVSKGIMISERASLFGDRVIAFVGMRHDESANSQVDNINYGEYQGVQYAPGSVVDYEPGKANTVQSGIVYKLRPTLSLYANYSQSYNPQRTDIETNRREDRSPLPPMRGYGWEAGVKSALFNETLNFTLTYFDITKKNVARVARDDAGNPLTIPGSTDRYANLNDVASKGVELDFNWRISRNLSTFGSFNWNDISFVKVENKTEQYLLGVRPDSTPEWAGSLAIKYAFDGKLKGFSVRTGIRYLGARLVNNTTVSILGNSDTRGLDTVIGGMTYKQYFFQHDAYTLVELGFSYGWRIGRSRHTAGISFKNLLGEHYMRGLRPGAPFAAYLTYSLIL